MDTAEEVQYSSELLLVRGIFPLRRNTISRLLFLIYGQNNYRLMSPSDGESFFNGNTWISYSWTWIFEVDDQLHVENNAMRSSLYDRKVSDCVHFGTEVPNIGVTSVMKHASVTLIEYISNLWLDSEQIEGLIFSPRLGWRLAWTTWRQWHGGCGVTCMLLQVTPSQNCDSLKGMILYEPWCDLKNGSSVAISRNYFREY